jgi:hypothetical protein
MVLELESVVAANVSALCNVQSKRRVRGDVLNFVGPVPQKNLDIWYGILA